MITFLLLNLFLEKIIKYDDFVQIGQEKQKKVFFTGRLLNLNVLGYKKEKLIFAVKLIRILDGDKIYIGSLKKQNNLYVLLATDSQIYVIDSNAKKIGEYTIQENDRIVSCSIDNMDSDPDDEVLLLQKNKSDESAGWVYLFELNDNGQLSRQYGYSFKKSNPWKVTSCDVDGDGKVELSVGVYKTTALHSILTKRPFIYNWHKDGISPKWLGSRLSRPFDDYEFIDIDGDNLDELLAIEILDNGKKYVNTYKWKGFGFQGIGQSISFDDISKIRSVREQDEEGYKLMVLIREKNEWYWVKLVYENGTLVVKSKCKDNNLLSIL